MQSTTITFYPHDSGDIEDRLFAVAIEHGMFADLNDIQRRAIKAFVNSKEFSLLNKEQTSKGFIIRISRRVHIKT